MKYLDSRQLEGAQVMFKHGPQHVNFLESKSTSMLVTDSSQLQTDYQN